MDANGSRTDAAGTCAGVVTATSCVDTGMAPGTWSYVDVPVQFAWTGPASQPSGPVSVG